jgi:hypothetical protein
MAGYIFDSSDLTQEQIDLLGGDVSAITYTPVWDPYDTPGWHLMATGTQSSLVVCPKPCGSVTLPPLQ